MAVWINSSDAFRLRCQPLPQAIRRAELLVGAGRLLRVVGGGVAPHHIRSGVAQQVLDVQLPGLETTSSLLAPAYSPLDGIADCQYLRPSSRAMRPKPGSGKWQAAMVIPSASMRSRRL